MQTKQNKTILITFVTIVFAGICWGEPTTFYDDDPVWQVPDSQNASSVKPWEIDLVYDLAENMFSKPGDPTPNVRAKDINTVDEVPNSCPCICIFCLLSVLILYWWETPFSDLYRSCSPCAKTNVTTNDVTARIEIALLRERTMVLLLAVMNDMTAG